MRSEKARKENRLPVVPADILIPGRSVDMTRWAVAACDQFTQDGAYWDRVYRLTEGMPSASHIMLPEYYLGEGKAAVDARIAAINETMEEYIDGGVFDEYEDSAVLTERTYASGKKLSGIVAAVDLSQYDYNKGSGSPVRATEATILERIPPRVAIREGACIEIPHILILIDDPKMTVIEPLEAAAEKGAAPLYDFELMENGGSVKGYLLKNGRLLRKAFKALSKLGDPETFRAKYNVGLEVPVLLLAVGDGNHSLATAKAIYERDPGEKTRFALAEIVNIHSPGIEFEPIHRVLMNVDPAAVKEAAIAYFGPDLITGEAAADAAEEAEAENCHSLKFVSSSGKENWYISKKRHLLCVGALQEFIDRYLKTAPGAEIDYIHGEAETEGLASRDDCCGFLLPAMSKSDLFPTVIKYGALPRKTFSMGTAEEKRYYLECRKIR